MHEKGTSERSICRTLKTCLEDPRSQSENVYGLGTSQPEELPDISLLDKFVFEMSPKEVESTLRPLEEISDDHLTLEKPVERELNAVQESESTGTQNSIELKKKQFPPGTKILADDSSEKDFGGNMDPFGNNSILNVTTEHTKGKAFSISLSDHPDMQSSAEDIYKAVKLVSPNIANQMTRRITEESQVGKASSERSSSGYFMNSFHQTGNVVSINDSAKCQNFNSVHLYVGMLSRFSPVQKAVGIESYIPIQTPSIPHKEDFISISRSKNAFYPTELQSPSFNFPRKVLSVPTNPKTDFSDPVPQPAQEKQDMFVPSECSQIYGFSPNYPNKVIITEQRSEVLHSSPCGNPQVSLHMIQPLYSSSGQDSKPLNVFTNISSRLPPDKPQCSLSVRCNLKMKLKKHRERPQPYTLDQRSNNDLLPNLDEIHTPF